LRVAERRQIAMVVQCPDDLVGAEHPVRMVMALVEALDVSRLRSRSRREREWPVATRTDPRLLVGVVVVRVYSGDWIGAGVGAAV